MQDWMKISCHMHEDPDMLRLSDVCGSEVLWMMHAMLAWGKRAETPFTLVGDFAYICDALAPHWRRKYRASGAKKVGIALKMMENMGWIHINSHSIEIVKYTESKQSPEQRERREREDKTRENRKKGDEIGAKRKKNKNKKETTKTVPAITDGGFSRFKDAYPKQRWNNTPTRKEWKSQSCATHVDAILTGLARHKASNGWRDINYVPLSSTFLHQEKWKDEVIPYGQRSTPGTRTTDDDIITSTLGPDPSTHTVETTATRVPAEETRGSDGSAGVGPDGDPRPPTPT
jgi:hypothetical protein